MLFRSDDTENDGDQAYRIITGATSSSDPNYAGLEVADVDVINKDVPKADLISLELVADRSRVTQGQPVGYRLAVRNRTGHAVNAIEIQNQLPSRFAMLKGTLAMTGLAVDSDARAAAVASGSPVNLSIPSLPPFVDRNGNGQADAGESGYLEFRWQLTPGAGATAGRYVAQVSAVSGCATCAIGSPASAEVTVEDNDLFARSTLLGRVFEDKDRDGLQSGDEPGLAGARVVMDDGTVVTTDKQGMFHVPDLEAGPRVIKMDLTTAGASAVATNGTSQVVDLAPGLLGSVRFGVAFPRDTVSMGRRGVDGLAIVVGEPEYGPIRVSGRVTDPQVMISGVLVPLTVSDSLLATNVATPITKSVKSAKSTSHGKAKVSAKSGKLAKASTHSKRTPTRKSASAPAVATSNPTTRTSVTPSVMLGDLAVGVDAEGRFEATVPPSAEGSDRKSTRLNSSHSSVSRMPSSA